MEKQKIYAVIPKIMEEVGAIEKSRKNASQNYQFRGIDDVYAAFQTIFAKNGVFVVPCVTKTTREERTTKNGGLLIYTTLEVKHTIYAEDGSFVEAVTVGEAMDSGDKSSNKAMSAAMKYALLEVFCVPTHDDKDTENDSPEPAAKSAEKKPPADKPKDSNNPALEAVNATVAGLKVGETCDLVPTVEKIWTPEGKKTRVKFVGDPTHFVKNDGAELAEVGKKSTVTIKCNETDSGVVYYTIEAAVPF